ncbi:uncharacterized protein LOC119027622 [Acanthopagrus latus]|uniref:uncharacterized protein LOC119027622 n=1 Tax=Acanthopagrus latus TaxID=8177 RepID=UPI00187CDD0E|nr:uncharacterized protein LOC119027622 [Acanthopagrus latus]
MEKMICRILLLISLNCVCGTFVVNVTQTSYQAEENHNITLEWTFTTTADTSTDSLLIFCEMRTDHKVSVLFLLQGGVVVPESQDQQFVGRVHLDKDALSDGRLRLHVSRLSTEDSGWYLCDVRTNYGVDSGECRLNVSDAEHTAGGQKREVTSHDWSKVEMVLRAVPFGALLFANLIVLFIAAERFLAAVIHQGNNSKKDENHNKSAHTDNCNHVKRDLFLSSVSC